jgi:hypothetical protein
MKNLELNGLNLQELNSKELLNIEGGSWLSRRFDEIGTALSDFRKWFGRNTGINLGNA